MPVLLAGTSFTWESHPRFVQCAAEGDRAGEVGHRGLDERRPGCRGGAVRPGDEGGGERRGAGDHAAAQADQAVEALRSAFLATPYRPTGLSTPARTTVRLVDELSWLNSIVFSLGSTATASTVRR
jgi:hypothetical protein